MLKKCGFSVTRPLGIIYKTCFDRGKFAHEWKKANVVPVHKKNYRPISLLTICGKTIEPTLYNSLFYLIQLNSILFTIS